MLRNGESPEKPYKDLKRKGHGLAWELSFMFTISIVNACLISLVLITVSFPFCRRIREAFVSGCQYPQAPVPWLYSGSQGLLECAAEN